MPKFYTSRTNSKNWDLTTPLVRPLWQESNSTSRSIMRTRMTWQEMGNRILRLQVHYYRANWLRLWSLNNHPDGRPTRKVLRSTKWWMVGNRPLSSTVSRATSTLPISLSWSRVRLRSSCAPQCSSSRLRMTSYRSSVSFWHTTCLFCTSLILSSLRTI